ncbi:tetratricopeptide repeat-containing diguanylate cyclase [Pseudoxanthomonas wuyuanensis]|nr:GGDEF domain-containing protein [Pseudoxanthomonas wuyuanensis]
MSWRKESAMKVGMAKALMMALVLCFACHPALAQDSAASLLKRADAVRTSDPTEFAKLLGLLEERTDYASSEEKMRFKLLKSHAFLMKGQYELAVGELKEIRETAVDDELIFRAGSMLVNTYALTRQFEEGLRTLNDTLPLADKVADADIRHRGWLVAGVLYNQVGEYALGEHYSDKVAGDSPVGRSRCAAGNLKIESQMGLKRSVDEGAVQQVIEICEEQKEPLLAGLTRTYLARVWAEAGKIKSAVALLERYLPDVQKNGYPLLISEYHSVMADLKLRQGEDAAAESHAQKAVENSTRLLGSQPLVSAYRTLYEIAEHRSDSELALKRYRDYADAEKAYSNDMKSRQLAYQIVRQQILQKNQQIDLLDKQNQVLQLQSKLNQQSAQNTRLMVILLVVLVASIGYWAYKIKRVQVSLKKMAETDALTDLCNRHHFTLQAERSLAQCARSGEEAALIMFDLDHFKQINDRYGHQTGDWTLKQVGEICKAFCRRVDTVGRLGGEEFAFLMYGCDMRAAKRLAEDCRVRIAAIDSRESGHVFATTASFGVASTLASGYSLARLLSHADRMLYRAKHLGRNRVCGTDDDTVTPLHGPQLQDSTVVADQHADPSEPALAARRIERVVS